MDYPRPVPSDKLMPISHLDIIKVNNVSFRFEEGNINQISLPSTLIIC
jgi:hypothetical protein